MSRLTWQLRASSVRVGLIARNTVREAMRQRLTLIFGVLALALVLGVNQVRILNFGTSELKFITDFGFGTMAFFGAALTVTATAQLFFSEIEQRTLLTLLAKPVARVDFVLGKFLGSVAITGMFCILLTLVLGAVLWWREAALMQAMPGSFGLGNRVNYVALAGVAVAQWIKLVVLAAWSLLVATFARSQLFAVAIGFFILVICQLQFLAAIAAERSGSTIGRALFKCGLNLFPDFQLFDLSESVAAGAGLVWRQVLSVGGYGGGYTVVLCVLAALSFRAREL